MSRMQEIDRKIERLKEKKKRLERQQAMFLLKQLQGILKEHFSPELVITLIAEMWTQATPQQKEEELKKAPSFPSAQTP